MMCYQLWVVGVTPCTQWEHVKTQGVFRKGVILEKVNIADPTIM